MFRFPKELLEETDIAPYCTTEDISLETVGPYQVLDLDSNAEEGEGWVEAEASPDSQSTMTVNYREAIGG